MYTTDTKATVSSDLNSPPLKSLPAGSAKGLLSPVAGADGMGAKSLLSTQEGTSKGLLPLVPGAAKSIPSQAEEAFKTIGSPVKAIGSEDKGGQLNSTVPISSIESPPKTIESGAGSANAKTIDSPIKTIGSPANTIGSQAGPAKSVANTGAKSLLSPTAGADGIGAKSLLPPVPGAAKSIPPQAEEAFKTIESPIGGADAGIAKTLLSVQAGRWIKNTSKTSRKPRAGKGKSSFVILPRPAYGGAKGGDFNRGSRIC